MLTKEARKILLELYREHWTQLKRCEDTGITIEYTCIRCGSSVQKPMEIRWIDDIDVEDFGCTVPLILDHWENIYPICAHCRNKMFDLASKLAEQR